MGIIGVTNTESGEIIQRLPVSIKLSIGTGPRGDQNFPQKLDHFLLQRKTKRDKDLIWTPAPDLHALYGDEPGHDPDWYVTNGKIKEVGVVLLDDDLENVFPTNYAWFVTSECRCRGELVQIANGGEPQYAMQAIRRTKNHPEGEPWPGTYKYVDGAKKGQPVESCGDGCPDLERGDCKPSGDFRCILDKMPMLGSIARLHTTSYVSVRQLHAGLQQIRKVTGGRLAGIRAMLKVRPERMTYTDAKGKHTTTVYVLSLEISAQDMQKLLENMTETAQLFQQTRKLLGGGRVEVVEDEEPRAREIAAEFYPENQPEEVAVPEKITETQWREMWAISRGNGLNDEAAMKIISSFGFQKSRDVTTDKFDEVCAKLKEPSKSAAPATAPAQSQAEAPPQTASSAPETAAPASTKPARPKGATERAAALVTLLDVTPEQLRDFVAKTCGVKTIKQAPKATLHAVLTAIEKLEGWVGAKNARRIVIGDKGILQLALQQWQDILFAELKTVQK